MPRASCFMKSFKCNCAMRFSPASERGKLLGWRRYTPISLARLTSMAVFSSSACMDFVAAVMGDRSPTIRRL